VHRLIAALALGLLAACAPKPPPEAVLRDLARPVYSNASYDFARLEGTWVQVADLAATDTGCAPGQMQVAGGQVTWSLCLNGRPANGQGALQAAGPGRFTLPGLAPVVWILWADADDRTLVLGTPGGQFGVILDRGALPADRAKAATDILAWNGYDVALLRR
jgi:apolipoprotein D and lipocalin family protein